jgi:Arc/MetJ family transcription regulator
MCKMEEVLPTNLSIDDKLINAAQRLGKLRTKKEVVTTALQFLIA